LVREAVKRAHCAHHTFARPHCSSLVNRTAGNFAGVSFDSLTVTLRSGA
jgi:hypothetical protein